MASLGKAVSNGALPQKKYSRVVITLDNVLIPQEKYEKSPSSQDGLNSGVELDLRILGCELIRTSGLLLKLPQVAMATGQVLFQRFYYSKSLVRYPIETTAMACIALASKIEERPMNISDVINTFNHIRQIKNQKTIQPVLLDNYINLKNQVIKAERHVLKELGFCCHVKHPHKIIITYLRLLEADKKKNLVQSSWNYMNDALRTDVFVRFSPETIACACIWLSGRQIKMPLPENPPWYHVFRIALSDIEQVAASILKLYTRKKVKLETLEVEVERIRKEQQEARLKSKTVMTLATPKENNTFSPASRHHSPKGKKPAERRKHSGGSRSHTRSPNRYRSKKLETSRKHSGGSRSHTRSSNRYRSKKLETSRKHSGGSRSHTRSPNRYRSKKLETSRKHSGGSRSHTRSPNRYRSKKLETSRKHSGGSRSHTRSPNRYRSKKLETSRKHSGGSRSHTRSPNRYRSKKPRRSDSRSRSKSRRSRSKSRDRHRGKKRSHSSPSITPPPKFIKYKDKGPIVRSVSRSRSRSPAKYNKYERLKHAGRQFYERMDAKYNFMESKHESKWYTSKEKVHDSRYKDRDSKKRHKESKKDKYYNNGYEKSHKKRSREKSKERDIKRRR